MSEAETRLKQAVSGEVLDNLFIEMPHDEAFIDALADQIQSLYALYLLGRRDGKSASSVNETGSE